MIRRILLPAVLAASLFTSGCFTLNMQVDSATPVLVNEFNSPGKSFFQEEERVMYFLWGLVNTNPRVVEEMVRDHKTKSITAFNVSSEVDAIGVLTGLVTLGIVSSRVVRVEGKK